MNLHIFDLHLPNQYKHTPLLCNFQVQKEMVTKEEVPVYQAATSFGSSLPFCSAGFSALTHYIYPVSCSYQQHAFLISLPGVCIDYSICVLFWFFCIVPCGVSLKGVIYKMKFYCIATWIQRGHIILMQNVFNNILNLLNHFSPWEHRMGVRQWAGNQIMWSKHHLNFPTQALLKTGTRTILLTSGFPEGRDSLSSARPVWHAPV